jgi:hypothetical protein
MQSKKIYNIGPCTIKILRIRNVRTCCKRVCLFVQANVFTTPEDASLLQNSSFPRKLRIRNVL